MGRSIRSELISPDVYEEQIKSLRTFHSPSKVYPYSNYITIEATETEIKLKLPLIIGEAINTGGMIITIPVELPGGFNVVVPCKDLLDAFKVVSGHGITFGYQGSYIEIKSPTHTLKVPLATENESMPAKIVSEMDAMRQIPHEPFDIDTLNDILKVLGKEVKSQTVSYQYHGIYISHDNSYVTNGMTISRMDVGLGMDDFYIPYHATKLFKHFEGKEVTVARKQLIQNKSPFMYFKTDGVEFYMQEWMSKDVYPVTQIKQLYELETIEMPSYELGSALVDVAAMGKMVYLDFKNGRVYDKQGKIEVTIPVMDLPELIFTSELLPGKAQYKDLEEISLVKAGDNITMIKYVFDGMEKLIAKADAL